MNIEKIAIQILDSLNNVYTAEEILKYKCHIRKYFYSSEPCFYDYKQINGDSYEYFMSNLRLKPVFFSKLWRLANQIRIHMMEDKYDHAKKVLLRMILQHSMIEFDNIQYDPDIYLIKYCKIWKD